MDLQDNKVLDARIRTALKAQSQNAAARRAILRDSLLERAAQQEMLPPPLPIRLRQNLYTTITRVQEGLRLLVMVILEDDVFRRAQRQRAAQFIYYTKKHRLGQVASDYLEPLRYNMMKINVY